MSARKTADLLLLLLSLAGSAFAAWVVDGGSGVGTWAIGVTGALIAAGAWRALTAPETESGGRR